MIKIFVLLVVLLMVSCNTANEFNELDAVWRDVTLSLNAGDEARALEKMRQYNAENKLVTRIVTLDKDGNEGDISNMQATNKIKLDFSKGGYNKSLEWLPIDKENVFILFRE